ncbi:MAG TPA: FMN-binding negative transcriptional regulator [Burkholderiaceae bacterium]|nr:FMN-binding negative transcriptional regulator [Burkholderiaceae bacterium]
MLYTPAHFAVERRAIAAALVRANPFATLITPGAEEPIVSHVPLLLAEEGDAWRLLGHLARANPQWEAWGERRRVVAIFHGGDAFISPRLYSARKAVPTWNYAVVHAHGTVEPSHDSATKEGVLKALIDRHDPAYRAQWDELDLAYREGMKGGIVAFTITVDRIDAKFKLGQNRPADDRARVLQAMQSGSDKERQLADWTLQLSAESE